MYNFVDINEVSGSILPSEALQINGEYIEELIPGYRTLSVTGRESLSPEIETYETGVRDGAKVKNKRFPARLIVVKYQIIAESSEAFRTAYNRLGGILNVQDAMLIFNDETDKFFIGTPYEVGEVEPGRNAVIGEFSILCADPFKYSVREYIAEASAGENSVLIDYNGTHKAYPTLESEFYTESEDSDDGETTQPLTGAGDCGFVSFFTEDEKIIQLGNPDEADVQSGIPASQTLMNQPFNTSGAWGTTSNNLWTKNNGYTILDTSQVGTPGMKALKFIAASIPRTSGELINATATAAQQIPAEYRLTASTYDRTEKTVKVTIIAKATIGKISTHSQQQQLNGKSLDIQVYIGSAWHSIKIPLFKNATHYFADGRIKTYASGYTVSLGSAGTVYTQYKTSVTFTISGLSGTTNALSDIKVKVVAPSPIASLATTACANLPVSPYTTATPASYYMTPTSYGSGTGWHGVVITRNVPADQTGEVGAEAFKLSYAQIFAGKTNEIGAFQMNLTDASNKSVAAVVIYKNKTGTKGKIIFYVNGVQAYGTERDLSLYNEFFGADNKSNKSTAIHKSGNKIIFNVGGIQKTIYNDDIANRKVTKLTFAFTQWSALAALSYNGIYNLKFIKNNCDTMKDIPNKFSANDVLRADCKTGEILLNGVSSPELGALGNDWEQFVLTPGLNEIGFAYSSWVSADYAPTIRVKYREVFL